MICERCQANGPLFPVDMPTGTGSLARRMVCSRCEVDFVKMLRHWWLRAVARV